MNPWRERLASDSVRKRVSELAHTNTEVYLLKLILGDTKIFEWALSIGTTKDAVLKSLAPPLPPDRLRVITADDAPEVFLWTGLLDLDTLLEAYSRHRHPDSVGRIRLLDFGCGCGRLLRFLVGLGDSIEAHGADVNAEHVAWCNQFLKPIRCIANDVNPRLPYPDGHFDLVWALSVFTHLDEGACDNWQAELGRILAPRGVLVITTHGTVAIEKLLARPDLAKRMNVDYAGLQGIREKMDRSGFAFTPYPAATLSSANAGSSYGLTYISRDYIERAWGGNDTRKELQLLEYLPGGLRGWQDIIVLGKKS